MFKLKRNDAEISEAVVRELAVSPSVVIYDLKVTVTDGKVTLEGRADSYGSKMEAELGTVETQQENDLVTQIAGKAPGVTNVINNLIITSAQN